MARPHKVPDPTPAFTPDAPPRVGQRVRLSPGMRTFYIDLTKNAHVSDIADVQSCFTHPTGSVTVVATVYAKDPDTKAYYVVKDDARLDVKDLHHVRGKPYLAGIDPVRDYGGHGITMSIETVATPTDNPHVKLVSLMNPSLTGATPPMTAVTPTPAAAPSPEAADLMAAVAALASTLEARQPKTAALPPDLLDRVTKLEQQATAVQSLLDAASEMPSTSVTVAKSAVKKAAAAKAAKGSIFYDRLSRFYRPGTELVHPVVLCSPPSLGKSFGVRQLGATYDVFVEHGCSPDIDEWTTLLGGPTPDNEKGSGFVTPDGVLAHAVRVASTGKTVLLFLDEVFRLPQKVQEALLSFQTGVVTPSGLVYRLRTRRVQDGALEVIECFAANLNIVAATNLTAHSPIEAFWSRWWKVRVDFTPAIAQTVASAILAKYGVTDPDARLAKAFANVMGDSRKKVSEAAVKFPADLRILQGAASLLARESENPDRAAVACLVADCLADQVANWHVDLGDADPASVSACVPWVTALKSVPATGTVIAHR